MEPTPVSSAPAQPSSLSIKQVNAGVLDVGYYEAGPHTGPPVVLLHGFPYSIESYASVAPLLAARGCRVIVPHLRGHGTTRFLEGSTPRSGQQSALGADVIALLDALQLKRAVLAGYDWGGRAACVAAALWPERCTGLVSVNGYLIQDIAKASRPLAPTIESGLWYQYYFQTERGRAGLTTNRRELARTLWERNSPTWSFDGATLNRHASAFDNPDYVEVVIHSYRHRLGLAAGHSAYEDLEQRLAALPAITVPSITLDGKVDGVVPATDGRASAAKFTGTRVHRVIEGAGHNLPEEAPQAFADAVWELASAKR
ncbi:alpha/beta hydrolase [Hymenobacter sp.]|uniref:alpha/beta fold hydrolase n=1 Tax=Hymenobacter sp. TaxID=1898978 RepID=UPI00286B25BF|nr:alpha/beta hydrolase [Hymenobacter sp.]